MTLYKHLIESIMVYMKLDSIESHSDGNNRNNYQANMQLGKDFSNSNGKPLVGFGAVIGSCPHADNGGFFL
jgi:hypothetical protein